MNNPPRKKNPTFGIAVFIVVAVSLVIATLFYNAITEKRDFDRQNAPAPSIASDAAAVVAKAAGGASQ
ncbi:hypothetical protein [Paraburkholderia lacunae]|uniref:Uncharacterized protein n=1 Tax=Paraburkholderia lacunae TaxID=2211104 RepID=A0A370MWX8_9BURK|nr:hypothetical protein [Paraburkholderia lacunae]RDJ97844.1 hypothetical protein DLM46_35840 [Paraburkholderia lacunae]